MSRTVHYNTSGDEIDTEESINDAPTYAQEQLAEIERRETVNHPSYYTTGGIEAIDAIEAWELGFHLGNVVKYIARAGRKTADSLQDLQKAAWYLNREIERMKKRKSMANRMEDEARMKLEPDKAYKVTKGNTDRSILTGDLVYIDGEDGSLVVPKGKGWINKNEQTQSVMDFECIRI